MLILCHSHHQPWRQKKIQVLKHFCVSILFGQSDAISSFVRELGVGESIKEKNCVRFWGTSGFLHFFHWRSVSCPNFFLVFSQGHALPQWVSSRSVDGAFRLARCPPNLHEAFNKIIGEVQGREAPPMDLKLTHYRQRVPRRKKRGKFFGYQSQPQNCCIAIKPQAVFKNL